MREVRQARSGEANRTNRQTIAIAGTNINPKIMLNTVDQNFLKIGGP